MSRPHVVVWDPALPSGVAPGMLMNGGTNDFAAARRRGVALLPVHPELVRLTAAGLVHVQGYGTGALFNRNHGEYGCPLLLLARPAAPYVHWAARIAPKRERLAGTLRILVNPDQPASLRGKVTPIGEGAVDLARLAQQEPDAYGGYTVGGVVQLRVGEGYVGLCLHAVATGCRVLWAAATLSDQP